MGPAIGQLHSEATQIRHRDPSTVWVCSETCIEGELESVLPRGFHLLFVRLKAFHVAVLS